jgi:hypothetical protein
MSASVTAGQTSYSMSITSGNLTASGYNGGILPQYPYQVIIWVNYTGTFFASETTTNLIPYYPSGFFLSPAPSVNGGGWLSPGNQTIVVKYTGYYVSGASVVISPSSNPTQVVFSQGVFFPFPSGTNQTIAAVNQWVATPGVYTATLTITAASTTALHHSYNTTTNFTVASTGGVVYVNSSSYQNATIIPGLSGGASAALLLVIGLIIGMIVAWLLARAVYRTPKVEPAQAWEGKPSATPSTECSICHQTFATEAEMKEHAKTAHGVQ